MTTRSAPRWASRNRLAAVLGALALAAAIILAARSRAGRSSQAVSDGLLFTVAEGPLTISVSEAGTIKPREQLIIKSEIEGRTTILYLIPEGTRVTEGDLLVELDASSLEDAKIDQEIAVRQDISHGTHLIPWKRGVNSVRFKQSDHPCAWCVEGATHK